MKSPCEDAWRAAASVVVTAVGVIPRPVARVARDSYNSAKASQTQRRPVSWGARSASSL